MFNIRFESADEDVGVLERLIEAALLAENPFSFYPEIILDSDNPCEENSPPTRCSTSFAPDSEYFGLLSAPVGESVDSALDLRLEREWHLCPRRWASVSPLPAVLSGR